MGASEKNEMDAYGVPATSRPRYFAFKVFGGWGVAGILFTLLVRCYASRSSDDKAYVKSVIEIQNEARKQARAEFREDYEYIMRVLEQKERSLHDAERKIDSLKTKI